jgi:ATP-binding cassette subfamily F protein uup
MILYDNYQLNLYKNLMNPPIYYIKQGKLSFAEKVLFENLEIFLYPNDRVCLIGRNGCGKSSLLKVIKGEYILDEGEIYLNPQAKIGYLAQKTNFDPKQTVYDYILSSLSDDIDSHKYKADIIIHNLKVDGEEILGNLSGGQLRRASLAKALVEEPEILLLDEPTNHLDIASIEWLEEYVKNYPGAVICISHDRSFLSHVTNKLWWLDRGLLRMSDKGFKYFEEWQEQIIHEEMTAFQKLGKKLDQENLWRQQGVTARRKRNQGRLAALHTLRAKFRSQQNHLTQGSRKLNIHDIDEKVKSKFIVEAEGLNFGYGESKESLIKNFSIRIVKGEKIGLIGPNGCGKTTLIRLLAGLEQPESGKVTHGIQLDISYFDQHKIDLKEQDSLWQTLCPAGGDQVFLPDGRSLHVAAYLKNFLFDPKQLNAKVATLSGGEASRLMLSKILAKPGNFLILDEPTNDLDMDSLEMLHEILSDYPGTLLVVSHDRDFLDRLVTRTLVFNGEGKVVDFAGGYEDYRSHYKHKQVKEIKATPKKNENKENDNNSSNNSKKLSYKFQRRLEIIPDLIKELEEKASVIETKLADPNLYMQNPQEFNNLTLQLEVIKREIDLIESEWLEIIDLQEKNG